MELYPDIEWVYSTATTPDKQIADIEAMVTKGIDGLVVLATESALTPTAKRSRAGDLHRQRRSRVPGAESRTSSLRKGKQGVRARRPSSSRRR